MGSLVDKGAPVWQGGGIRKIGEGFFFWTKKEVEMFQATEGGGLNFFHASLAKFLTL